MITELLFPLMARVDIWLGLVLGEIFRIPLWGMASGAAGLGLYGFFSNQEKIRFLKDKTRSLRRRMMESDLTGKEFTRTVTANLAASFSLLRHILLPAVVSAVPILFTGLWINTYLGFDLPAKSEVVITAQRADTALTLVSKPDNFRSGKKNSVSIPLPLKEDAVKIAVDGSTVYQGNPFDPPLPEISKKRWYNFIIGNADAGYIRASAPFDTLHLTVQKKRFFSSLPSWLSGWESLYFLGVFIGALSIKLGFKLE